MEMSITRALSELKLLAKKIEGKTENIKIAAPAGGSHSDESKDRFVTEARAALQQIKDFIKRRKAIKSAVVLSNADTVVKIGDKSMTVAEAIERKTSIEHEKDLVKQLRNQYYSAKEFVERENEKVKANADKQAEAALGAETARKKGEEYESIYDAYYSRHKAELISLDNMEKIIEGMQDDIDEFEAEVDFVLSESNTKTMISV